MYTNLCTGYPESEAIAINRATDLLNEPSDLSTKSPLSLISKYLKVIYINIKNNYNFLQRTDMSLRFLYYNVD